MRILRLPALALLAFATAACSGDKPAAPEAAKPVAGNQPEWTDAARIEAIASTLQACSYEGSPVTFDTGKLQAPAPGDCKNMVDRIMGFTGLPANFVVTAGAVPNAAAVILLDDANVPQRVIAFNPDFIRQSEQATGGDVWAPVSIMAHEIGHHLSGHTITSGGSRPEIELEADKFSGYVLQKMGAPLAAATQAILTLGTDTDQPTHPSKTKRAAAIGQGWQEACKQTGAADCNAGTAAIAPTPTQQRAVVALPAPSANAIPFKFGRFVVDETGKLDPKQLRELDTKLFNLAKTKGLEFVVLVVNDLHGMSGDDYAWAMMRQLRIGKLDLGNGGVIVIAPKQGKSGGAFAPGVAKALESFDAGKRFDIDFRDGGWQRGCPGSDGCIGFTGNLLRVVDSQLRLLDTKWEIRFTSIEDVIKDSKQRLAQRRAGRKWEDMDNAIGALVRFTGTVTDTAPHPKPETMQLNERIMKDGKWRAILVKTTKGQEVTLYMQPRTPSLMPSGELKRGVQYTFVGQMNSAGQYHTDYGVIQTNPSLWLFSYEAL